MTRPAKSLFLPAGADAGRVALEPRAMTSSGQVSAWGVRVRSVTETYRRRGQLTARQARAAERLFADWSAGLQGAREPLERAGEASGAGWEQHRLERLEAYRRALERLGKRLAAVIVPVVCEDCSVDALSKRWRVDRKGLMALLRLGLDELGDFYRLE